MNVRFSLAGWAAIAALAAPPASAEVPLLSAPDNDAAVVARVAASDPAVVSGSPALGTVGWHWSEYDASITGHVPAARVGKNFRIAPGTAVRAAPDPGAAVLARVADGDSIDIVASRAAWVEIRLAKTVPVYFRKPPGGAARPAATPPPAVQPAQPPRPAPAAAGPPAEAAAGSPIVVSTAEAGAAQPPRQPKPPAGTPMRVFSGKLVRDRGADSGPRFTLSLRQQGRLLAYVDISRLFVRDLRPFLDNEVIVMGEVSSISPGGTELVIHARTLRIKP